MRKSRIYAGAALGLAAMLAIAVVVGRQPPFKAGNVPPRITAGTITPADEQAWLDTSDLVYTSDYFSFVGNDAQGFVAFALDNNRGRDGNDYQAEHVTAMHDQHIGWIEVEGTGRFENARHELVEIPNSPFFQFTGDVRTGLTIMSPRNHLVLEIAPVVDRVIRHDDQTFYALATALAKLRWSQRTIEGRVIYEDFIRINFNRMTRKDLSLFRSFNALYLLTADRGDLYIRSSKPGSLPVPEPVFGFRVDNDRSEALGNLRVEETSHRLAWGLYRWPTAWEASWGWAARAGCPAAGPAFPKGNGQLGGRGLLAEHRPRRVELGRQKHRGLWLG